jgi:DnaJ-domain-containing protein 1
MSIGKRLIDLARSELNSLLDKAADHDADLHSDRWGGDLEGVSEHELEAELERRRRAREEAEEAATGRKAPPRAQAQSTAGASSTSAGAGARPGAGARRPEPPRRTPSGDEALRKAYAALEVPPGSDFETVRKAYRRLMRKYHPDLHTGSPEAQRAANDLAQRLTQAYKLLEKQIRK